MKNKTKKTREELAEEYLKNLKHPEIEFYGLNCDVQLWANFNKELRMREIMDEERAVLNHMMMLLGIPENCNYSEEYNAAERLYASAKLSLLVQQGKIGKLNYEVKDENYVIHINSNSI